MLGASRYQLEVIEAAKRLGYRVLTTDNVPSNPGHRVADASFDVDTTDAAAVLRLARAERITGIVAPCTDVAVTTAAKVGEALGLPHVPPRSAQILTSKIGFRQWQRESGLPHPAFAEVGIAALPPFPCIVKPEGSSGSKGIFVVEDERAFEARVPETRGFARDGRVVLESHVPGRQGTCEGVILEKELALAVLTDRETADPPYVATAGHRVPSTLSPLERTKVLGAIGYVLEVLGIDDTPFDCDFVFGDDGEVYLLELTPRLGGNSLTRLVREAVSVDLAQVAVRLACGEKTAPTELGVTAERPVAQLVLGVPEPGALTWDEAALARLREAPWVRDVVLDVPFGTRVEAFVNGRTRVGEATLVAATRDELDARVDDFRARLALDAR